MELHGAQKSMSLLVLSHTSGTLCVQGLGLHALLLSLQVEHASGSGTEHEDGSAGPSALSQSAEVKGVGSTSP